MRFCKGKPRVPVTQIVAAMARYAAIAAESARLQGSFEAFHRALYDRQASLSDAVIAGIAHTVGLDMAATQGAARRRAEAAVNEDITSAQRLGVQGTPTFFLCMPGGRVWRLPGLDQAQGLLP